VPNRLLLMFRTPLVADGKRGPTSSASTTSFLVRTA